MTDCADTDPAFAEVVADQRAACQLSLKAEREMRADPVRGGEAHSAASHATPEPAADSGTGGWGEGATAGRRQEQPAGRCAGAPFTEHG